MTPEEAADRLRNSDCCHNTPDFTVTCAADCNRCVADAIRAAVAEELRLLEELAQAKAENVQLREALRVLANAADAYMDYHAEKFYAGVGPKPTGLRVAAAEARRATEEK